MGLVGIVDAVVYKTAIFTGHRHGKLSQFLKQAVFMNDTNMDIEFFLKGIVGIN